MAGFGGDFYLFRASISHKTICFQNPDNLKNIHKSDFGSLTVEFDFYGRKSKA